jgi:GNAT superfamily N-acetyltransferase
MGSLEVVAFDDAHVAGAAALVADEHRAVGVERPGFEPALADRGVARAAIDAGRRAGPGVAALAGRELVGFVVSSLDPRGDAPAARAAGAWPSPASLGGARRARVGLAHHGAAVAERRAAYRAMYTALAGRFVALGCFRHQVGVPVGSGDTVRAWFELGFGVDQVHGVRSTRPLGVAVPDVDVRPARPGALGAVAGLAVDLQVFHARSPMLEPVFVSPAAARASLEWTLRDDRSAIWVAVEGGAPVGFMAFAPDARASRGVRLGIAAVAEPARSRGLGTSILDAGLRWARGAGYEVCLVGWTSANPDGDRFWRGRGFAPIYLTLSRRIDDRIAGATARR